MRRKSISIAIAVALMIALIPAPQSYAVNSVIYYTVRYVCVCGPCPPVVGYWTRECDGYLHGWGVAPYTVDPCYRTDVSYGDLCED